MDWSVSYNPTWRYMLVDRETWRDVRPLEVMSCRIDFDLESAVPESASIEMEEQLPPESIVRVYLDAEQDGEVTRVPVATVVLTGGDDTFGVNHQATRTGYGPLLALEDDFAPLLETSGSGTRCIEKAADICEASCMAPVVKPDDSTLLQANVTAEPSESLLAYARALAAKAGYDVMSDGYGRTTFPRLKGLAMVPKAVLRDDGKTVLVGDVKRTRDLRKVPNYCEVLVTRGYQTLIGSATNDNPASPISTVSRGRRVPLERMEDPDDLNIPSTASDAAVRELASSYAREKLISESKVACTISLQFDYMPLRVGDCVRAIREDFDRSVTLEHMSLTCDESCMVEATASYIEDYWEAA